MKWAAAVAPVHDALYFGDNNDYRIVVSSFGGGWYALTIQFNLSIHRPKIYSGYWKIAAVDHIRITNQRKSYHELVRGEGKIKDAAVALAGRFRLNAL